MAVQNPLHIVTVMVNFIGEDAGGRQVEDMMSNSDHFIEAMRRNPNIQGLHSIHKQLGDEFRSVSFRPFLCVIVLTDFVHSVLHNRPVKKVEGSIIDALPSKEKCVEVLARNKNKYAQTVGDLLLSMYSGS